MQTYALLIAMSRWQAQALETARCAAYLLAGSTVEATYCRACARWCSRTRGRLS